MQSTSLSARSAVGPFVIVVASTLAWLAMGVAVVQAMAGSLG